MHIAKVPNRNARPSFLLRETYREDGKVKNRTPANLSKLPIERIETLRAALRGDPLAPIAAMVSRAAARCRMATSSPR
jgi:hypothetical protein